MYVPEHFKEKDSARLRAYIREYGFGLLIVSDDDGIEANHLPFYIVDEGGESLGYLHCHLARNNPAWKGQKNPGAGAWPGLSADGVLWDVFRFRRQTPQTVVGRLNASRPEPVP